MSDDSATTDEALASMAQRGDAVAFDRLARRYLRRAMALAWQELRSVEDAEDAVQESFHRAVRALRDFDSARQFAPWFFTIVRNVVRSTQSKTGRRSQLLPVESLTDVDDSSLAPTQSSGRPEYGSLEELDRALGSLPEQQQACLRLCDVEGYTSGEAGAMLGVSEGTVRTHLHRARQSLRAKLAPVEESA